MPELSHGLNIRVVRQMLADWQAEPLAAMFSADGTAFIAMWDFIPPGEVGGERLRLTFINDELEHWGPPSEGRVPPFFT
jgi:hypothetical protein